MAVWYSNSRCQNLIRTEKKKEVDRCISKHNQWLNSASFPLLTGIIHCRSTCYSWCAWAQLSWKTTFENNQTWTSSKPKALSKKWPVLKTWHFQHSSSGLGQTQILKSIAFWWRVWICRHTLSFSFLKENKLCNSSSTLEQLGSGISQTTIKPVSLEVSHMGRWWTAADQPNRFPSKFNPLEMEVPHLFN